MTPDDLTPDEVQLLIDLADTDVAEHEANFRVVVSRITLPDEHAKAALIEEASRRGIRHAELRQQWINLRKAKA